MQETAAVHQGDGLTSLISAGPPCPADRRKLFIPKLKWDMASYHSYLIWKTNDIQSQWQNPNKETRLTDSYRLPNSKGQNF